MGFLRVGMVFVLAVGGVACSVERPAIDDRIYLCQSDDDCGEGYTCFLGVWAFLPDGGGFCAPRCGPACPDCECEGFCAGGACLETCDPSAPEATCRSGSSCLRTRIEGLPPSLEQGPAGVCTPAPTCDTSEDCRETGSLYCLADLLLDPTYRMDHAACVGTPCGDGQPCPRGFVCTGDELGEALSGTCWPSCSGGGHCPIGMSCAPTAGLCVPSFKGSAFSCDNDLNCLIGRCLDVGNDSRSCVVECEGDGLCEELPYDQGYVVAPYRVCNEFPQLGVSLCVLDLLGTPCATNDQCADGLECRVEDLSYGLSEPYRIPVCTRGCDWDTDCEEWDGVCIGVAEGRVCRRRGRMGDPCALFDAGGSSCSDGLDCVAVDPGEPTIRFCTEGCTPTLDPCPLEGSYCTAVASGEESGVCFMLGLAGSRCREGQGDTMCGRGLSCLHAMTPYSPDPYPMCSTACEIDAQCAVYNAFCASDPQWSSAEPGAPGLCVSRLPVGYACDRDEQCSTANCNDTLGVCLEPR